jgi:hypothetical protein
VKKHKEHEGWSRAEAVQESFGTIAEKETDLKRKRLFRPRWVTIESWV